ncbi:MAG TPA: hypothetical protein VHE09_14495, partial [Rhizomicrobium sp.]|nr:hypothetical protein [Rhizomicrobium sp.]
MPNEIEPRLDLPVLVPAPGGAVVCATDGSCEHVWIDVARGLFLSGNVIVAHSGFVAGRLKTNPSAALFDVLELFVFVRPGQPCVPSALGLARCLVLPIPHTPEDSARVLREAAEQLLGELSRLDEKARASLRPLAETMGRSGWRWAPHILEAIGRTEEKLSPIAGLETWRALPIWEDDAAPDKPGSLPVDPKEARMRLQQLVGLAGETRPEQASYTDAASYAFTERERVGAPRIALVEAGTGVGKTLGYLAPASVWAEKNGPGLWISTYTRNLQRQIMQEIARLYP